MSLLPTQRRPRVATASSTSTISPASSAAALVPRTASGTRSPLSESESRSLSPPLREPIESYTLWQPILRASDQIVLYNPSSHAINIVPASLHTVSTQFTLPYRHGHRTDGPNSCPYCHRPLDDLPGNFAPGNMGGNAYSIPQIEMSPDYFQVLEAVNGGVIDIPDSPPLVRSSFARLDEGEYAEDSHGPSRRWSRVSIDSDSDSDDPSGGADRTESLRDLSGQSFVDSSAGTPLGRSTTHLTQPASGYTRRFERASSEEPETGRAHESRPSNGYYSTFFREETRLGMGANGSVFLCQVGGLLFGSISMCPFYLPIISSDQTNRTARSMC